MDLCHVINAVIARHLQNYKEQLGLRGDDVKDVSMEQGASDSQMAAAKFLATISKLRGMDGRASDAVSAHTQVEMTDAPRLLPLPKDKCLEKRPKHWNNTRKILWFLLRGIENSHPLAGLLWAKTFEESCTKMDGM